MRWHQYTKTMTPLHKAAKIINVVLIEVCVSSISISFLFSEQFINPYENIYDTTVR